MVKLQASACELRRETRIATRRATRRAGSPEHPVPVIVHSASHETQCVETKPGLAFSSRQRATRVTGGITLHSCRAIKYHGFAGVHIERCPRQVRLPWPTGGRVLSPCATH